MITTKQVEGYLLTNIEKKAIDDFNNAANMGMYIETVPYKTKFILEKMVVDNVLCDSYWNRWHDLIRQRISSKVSSVYNVEFDVNF